MGFIWDLYGIYMGFIWDLANNSELMGFNGDILILYLQVHPQFANWYPSLQTVDDLPLSYRT